MPGPGWSESGRESIPAPFHLPLASTGIIDKGVSHIKTLTVRQPYAHAIDTADELIRYLPE
jgi:hypothetical protein